MGPPRGVSWWPWPDASACRCIISGWGKARTICSPLWPGISHTRWWGRKADESSDPAIGLGLGSIADFFRGLQISGHLRRHRRLHGGGAERFGDRLLAGKKNFAHAALRSEERR